MSTVMGLMVLIGTPRQQGVVLTTGRFALGRQPTADALPCDPEVLPTVPLAQLTCAKTANHVVSAI